MGEELHYEWSTSPTNNRDSGLLPQATRPISGCGLSAVGVYWKRSTALKLLVYSTIVLLVALCARHLFKRRSNPGRRIGDADLDGDTSSLSSDADENTPCGDLRNNNRRTSPGVHDESPPQLDAASTQAPGTGAAEEGVSSSCEDEASGDAAAAVPEAAGDDEDDDSNSNCSTPLYDIVCSGRGRTSNDGESTSAEPQGAQAAPGRESVERKMDRLGRARWVGPLAGLLESAGKKISRTAPKSAVAASPATAGIAGETATRSSEAPQPEGEWRFNAKLAVGDSKSPHYKDLRKPYDFPNLKAHNYAELRKVLLKLAESMGNLCSPHSEPFCATVKADCDICGVGTVTFYIQFEEEEMKSQSSLAQLKGKIFSNNPFSKRFPERFTRDLLALTEELILTVSDRAQKTKWIKPDAEGGADRDGEQGERKTDAPIQAGSRAGGSSANELVGPMRTAQATVGDAATAAASDVATPGTSRCTKSEASEAAGSPKGVPNSSSKRHFEKLLQGVSWFGGEKSTSVSGEAPAKASVGSESKQTGWTPAPVAAASATGAHGEGRADEAPEDLSEDEMVRPHRGAQTAESKPTQDGRSGDDSSSVHL
ncbi:hypothetical protein ENH_00011290, partial [Eimeria necatrix]